MEADPYELGNEGKVSFDLVYNRPDPRAYFSTLEPLNYVIPGQAKPVFKTVIEIITEQKQENDTKVVDVGCSYGVNGALLKYDCSMQDLYEHYCTTELDGISRSECLSRDRDWIDSLDPKDNLTVVGLDISEQAVQYGLDAGFLDNGIAANLEEEKITRQIENEIADADLIISTGCVGYITETTFSKLLSSFDEDSLPWVASFVLRMFPYNSIHRMFSEKGLLTEKLVEPTFVQRNFRDEGEKEHVIRQLRAQGIDPFGKEEEGSYIANLFLSRPEPEIRCLPLEEMLKGRISHAPNAYILEPENNS